MRDHPCFSCTLPDCDERSKACRWKQTRSIAHRKLANGIEPSPVEAAVRAEYAVYHWLDWAARRAEAGGTVRRTPEASPHA